MFVKLSITANCVGQVPVHHFSTTRQIQRPAICKSTFFLLHLVSSRQEHEHPKTNFVLVSTHQRGAAVYKCASIESSTCQSNHRFIPNFIIRKHFKVSIPLTQATSYSSVGDAYLSLHGSTQLISHHPTHCVI